MKAETVSLRKPIRFIALLAARECNRSGTRSGGRLPDILQVDSTRHVFHYRRMSSRPRSSRSREIMVVDETPIRRRAVTKCKYILKQYDVVARSLDKHREVDVPQFRRWYQTTFSVRLTEARELEAEVSQLEVTLERIQYLQFFHDVDGPEAVRLASDVESYNAFLRRKYGEPESDWDGEYDEEIDDDEFAEEEFGTHEFGPDGFGEDEFLEDDDIDWDAEWVRDYLYDMFDEFLAARPEYSNVRPDTEEYERLFESFCAELREECSEDAPEDDEDGDVTEADLLERESNERLKRLYRSLVKALHPDYRDGDDPATDDMWHSVQDAYQRGDLDALEALRAGYEIRHRGDISSLPVSHILAIHAEHKEQLKELRRIQRSYKREAAWEFSSTSNKDLRRLRADYERDIAAHLEYLTNRRDSLRRSIDRVAQPLVKQPIASNTRAKKARYVPPNQSTLF